MGQVKHSQIRAVRRTKRRLLAACALALGLLTTAAAPAFACGDTPGFCPNPTPGHGCNWFTC